MGTGHLGDELATFVTVPLQFLDVPMERVSEFEEAALDGYLAGLTDAGWRGGVSALRIGYKAAACLFMGVATAGIWFGGLSDPASEALTERVIGRPLEQIAEQWARMQPYLLDLGEEALAMLDRGLARP
jgi:hypothetical protein